MVVSTAYLMIMLLLCACVFEAEGVYWENCFCGFPVRTVSSAEAFFPNLTTCGLSVRKSRIQLHVGVGITRSASLAVSFNSLMVLKA